MFKKSKFLIGFIYIGLSLMIIIGFTFGYIYTRNKVENNKIISDMQSYEAVRNIENSINDSDMDAQNTILNNTNNIKILETQEIYNVCGHKIVNRNIIPEDIKNLNESQFRIAYSDWEIVKYSDDEIIISRVINKKCPNHYILKEIDGKVAILYQQEIDGTFLKELTNVSTINLKKLDQQKLKEGIAVDSNEKLAEILEDFSS